MSGDFADIIFWPFTNPFGGERFTETMRPFMQSQEAGKPAQASRTAQPLEQLSEKAKQTRRRKASLITKDWAEPKLGYAGLLGI